MVDVYMKFWRARGEHGITTRKRTRGEHGIMNGPPTSVPFEDRPPIIGERWCRGAIHNPVLTACSLPGRYPVLTACSANGRYPVLTACSGAIYNSGGNTRVQVRSNKGRLLTLDCMWALPPLFINPCDCLSGVHKD